MDVVEFVVDQCLDVVVAIVIIMRLAQVYQLLDLFKGQSEGLGVANKL